MANVRHGARSQGKVTKRAGYEKQRITQRLGLNQGDLSKTGRYWLDRWAIPAAEVYLMEQHIAEHGLIDEDGRLAGFTNALYAARNHVARMYSRLEPHLLEAVERKEGRGRDALHRHLETNYGNGAGR